MSGWFVMFAPLGLLTSFRLSPSGTKGLGLLSSHGVTFFCSLDMEVETSLIRSLMLSKRVCQPERERVFLRVC